MQVLTNCHNPSLFKEVIRGKWVGWARRSSSVRIRTLNLPTILLQANMSNWNSFK